MKEQIDTLIGENTRVTGDLHFRGGLHVDGVLEGTITAEGSDAGTVVISEKGTVKGEINAPRIIVNGTVDGDLVAGERVELQENARVSGNIRYSTIEMTMGARVDGKLEMSGSATPKPAKP